MRISVRIIEERTKQDISALWGYMVQEKGGILPLIGWYDATRPTSTHRYCLPEFR